MLSTWSLEVERSKSAWGVGCRGLEVLEDEYCGVALLAPPCCCRTDANCGVSVPAQRSASYCQEPPRCVAPYCCHAARCSTSC